MVKYSFWGKAWEGSWGKYLPYFLENLKYDNNNIYCPFENGIPYFNMV